MMRYMTTHTPIFSPHWHTMIVKPLLTTLLCACYFVTFSYAATNSKVYDFSGEYLCKGNNEAVGDYEVSVTLKKSYRNSVGSVGVYELATETENNETYTGQAVTNGNQIALTFKLSSAKHAEFSTGTGQFQRAGQGKWTFKNNYYEPDDSGGNYGQEHCMLVKLPVKTVPKKLPVKAAKP